MAGLTPASGTTEIVATELAPLRRRGWRKSFAHRSLMIGLVLTVGLLLTALTSLFYTPYDPLAMNIADRLQRPAAAHWFGTDHYGRDLLSRIMRGATVSMSVGIISVGIGLVVGVVLGVIAGYAGRWADEVLMRGMDALYGFPAILLALLITSVFGPGLSTSMVAIGIVNVPVFARLLRANVLVLRERDFVVAARALGATEGEVVWRHFLPNAVSPLLVQATISFPNAILAEAGLSYLGLGMQPPHPSWGSMLKEAQPFLRLAPTYAIFPGAAIALAVLGCNLLGDGLRDVLDPKVSHRR
ncbi:MAG TPA: ABC transporter permease [Alphaproteobacteria bacterium]|nr:ABC transporter permease [Alphaproteobacteria bacterium]